MPLSTFSLTYSEPEMLKKSNATPYTMQLSTNSHTPLPGLPRPKKPKRNTHANMAISITFLMPNLPRNSGMSSMQSVSESWLSEIRALALRAPQVSAYAGISWKEVMKVLA